MIPETPSRITPCLLNEASGELLDLLTDVRAAAQLLGSRLHPKTAAELADRVRVMNSYYSNRIEGHVTRPREIERAMADDLDADEPRRNLQLEAREHVRLQRSIDQQYAAGTLPDPASTEYLRELHREFYRHAPPAMLHIAGRDRELTMIPGELRARPDEDNVVGRHHPPASAVVDAFMAYFEDTYAYASLSSAQQLLALPSSHHRFNFIHPFPDGNGRVSRLMSHSMALKAGIGAHGLWSISRGLARGLAPGAEGRAEYMQMMNHADLPRQGDLDGRGNLSQRALTDFSVWFLKVCLDQIRYMGEMFQLESLAKRLKSYAVVRGWREEAQPLLIEVLHRGEVSRGEAIAITGLKERTGRDLLRVMLEDAILASDSPKTPISLRFPVKSLEKLFPHLYPSDYP